jgi:hypothetical protein
VMNSATMSSLIIISFDEYMDNYYLYYMIFIDYFIIGFCLN